MLARLDAFLLARVFQPTADALSGITTPTGTARFCVTGAMVFVIAGMLASTAKALPTWAILLDFANLWAGMAMLHHLARSAAGSTKAYRSMFGLARPVLACCTISFWIIGANSVVGSFAILRFTLWCMTLYFASCDPPSRWTSSGMHKPDRSRMVVGRLGEQSRRLVMASRMRQWALSGRWPSRLGLHDTASSS